MTAADDGAPTALQVARHLHTDAPWEVYGERCRRYEIHLNGLSVEMERGPILLEGYGVRVFRHQADRTGIGFQASTDLSEAGVRAATEDAESLARHSNFPAKEIELPGAVGDPPKPDVLDRALWDRPIDNLREYVDALFRSFDGIRDAVPSFGSVRATLTETTMTNSSGLEFRYPQTTVWFELAVKATGGPEGRPPGEYWVNDSFRRLEPSRLDEQVCDWCRIARDVRRAEPSPTGELPVLLPASILATIFPAVLGYRFTGAARLRGIAPEVGSSWGNDGLTVYDDGLVPWAIGTSPVDDEGTPQRRRTLIDRGKVSELYYDVRHAGAFGVRPTGSAVRGRDVVYMDWRRFLHPPVGTSTTLTIAPGPGGTDEELMEAAGDGIWVQQLGWAVPDPISGSFGGEIRIGYRVRGGKLGDPIRGGTVGGSVLAPGGGHSLLNDAVGIGAKPTLVESVLAPTMLVKSLTVAGSG